MELFQTLGAEIEKLWRDKNYDETLFPEIAANGLKEANLPEKISAWDVIDWTLNQTHLPVQQDVYAKFADPPITIYNCPRFHIDVYFWLEGTTAIHQHAFCGAFQVLHGSSLHSWYDFQRSESINTFTEIGGIDLKLCELLSCRRRAADLGWKAVYSRAFSSRTAVGDDCCPHAQKPDVSAAVFVSQTVSGD